MISPVLFIVVLAGVLAALWGYSQWRRSVTLHVFRLFGLNTSEYELLGYDLGSRPKKVFLRADGLVGVPDAVFKHRADHHVLIGEFKSRAYRGHLTDYERYQMTLYQGVAQRRYRQRARGLFAFGCGRVVEHAFDPNTYAQLLPLANKLRSLDVRRPRVPHRRSRLFASR